MATQKKSEAFSLIPRRKLLALYSALLRCRLMEEFASDARRSLRTGHEASAVAVVIDLKAGDILSAAARDFLPAFVNGQSPQAILSELRGRSAVPRASFAKSLKDAVSRARAHAQKKNRCVVALFASGPAVSSAAWRNALRTAGAERLPILFVSHDSDTQTSRAKSSTHPHLGFPDIPVDRDDVVAIYRVASEALAHARRGNGPTLIECVAWPASLAQNAAASDAIAKMERYLAHTGVSFARVKRKTVEEMTLHLRAGARSSSRSTRRKPRPA